MSTTHHRRRCLSRKLDCSLDLTCRSKSINTHSKMNHSITFFRLSTIISRDDWFLIQITKHFELSSRFVSSRLNDDSFRCQFIIVLLSDSSSSNQRLHLSSHQQITCSTSLEEFSSLFFFLFCLSFSTSELNIVHYFHLSHFDCFYIKNHSHCVWVIRLHRFNRSSLFFQYIDRSYCEQYRN